MFKTKLIGAIVVTSVSLSGLFIDSASAQTTPNGSDISGGVGSDISGGMGSDITGGTGSDITGGTGSDITGGTGSDITGGTPDVTGGNPNPDVSGDNPDVTPDTPDITGGTPDITVNPLDLTFGNLDTTFNVLDVTGDNLGVTVGRPDVIPGFIQFGGLNPLIIERGRKLAEKITEAYINCTPCGCGSTKICETRRFSINPPATNTTTTTSQTRRFLLGTPNANRTCNQPGKPQCEELHVLLMETDLFIENVDRQVEAYKDRLANRLW